MQLTLRVTSVTLGAFGGFVFGGKRIDKNSGKIYLCKAKHNLCTRSPRTGEVWTVKGSETAHEEFKTFMTLESCSIISIESTCDEGLLKWHLKKHHSFRGFGFGDRKIDKLVDAVGAEELINLFNDGNWLHLSDFISEHIAQMLTEKWLYLKNEFETIQFLIENNIPLSVSKRLLRICRIDTVERLKANPYALVSFCDIVPNIWPLVENLAACLDISKSDERRLVGMIEISLYKRLNRGHTGTSQGDLKSLLLKALKQEPLVEKAIKAALSMKAICFKDIDGKRFYQLTSIGYIEFEVEKSLNNLMNKPVQSELFYGTNGNLAVKLDSYNGEFFERNGYLLTETQLNAVSIALTNNLAVIDGYGGTGKTTILQAVADLSGGYRTPYIVALSGKAKERAKESTGLDTYTIHDFISKLHNKKISRQDKMIIVIDEASMVDILLMSKLFDALGSADYRLLMVGDEGQLPPVGFGLCFHRLVDTGNTERLKVIKLREVHRTKATGMLHQVAMEIRKGKIPALTTWSGEKEGVYLLPCSTKEEMHQVLLNTKSMLPAAQIVTSHVTEKRMDSAKEINNFIQYNLQDNLRNERFCMLLGKTRIMEDDPVLVTQNMYEYDLYNGNTGVVESVYYCEDTEEVSCNINFGDKGIIKVTKSDAWMLGLELAYGISVHKSQGSEYDTTIVCTIEDSPLLDRSLFYTALTRSKKLTLIAGRYDVARRAVERGNRSSKLDVVFAI
ncbi:exodeoxyribonuclease V alpha subunit [Vibrio crassostreae]|nr:exodeoxyribonuclease V alpha subunit [Vibrio crassostreae]